jgi:SNF2 family DNA or RNA helicase
MAHLIRTQYLRGVVIVAPIRVIRLVWRQEAAKWQHTQHLKFSMVTGTRDQRTRALLRPADIYLINYENLGWLAETLQTYFVKKDKPLPFNGVVWDEISKCKNSATNRVKAVKKILDKFDWTTGLTGTPASNGYKDLHGQFLVVDKGQRLGVSKTAFRTRFYRKVGPYKEVAYEDTEDTIKKLIGDITLEMSAEDYNPLPDLIVNNIEIEMPDDLRTKYEKMEREFFLQLDSGKEVEMFNQASLTNKCLQFSNGAMYPVAGMPLWEPIHDLKLDALEEIIDEAQGSPVLCSYAYRSDAARIMEKFKHLDPINLTDCKSESALLNAMHRWKTNDCALMIGHPASMGHGIDGLQKNGHILVWFGLNWSLDLYEQMNARVRRQGQGVPVICHRIMCQDTLDQAQALALDEKATTQQGLRNAVKQYRETKESK